MSAPAVADLALVLDPPASAAAAVGSLAAVDDHGHVRVVLVVLDHLVVELVGELPRDHAIDHSASDCRWGGRRCHPPCCPCRRRRACQTLAMFGTTRPCSSRWAFQFL